MNAQKIKLMALIGLITLILVSAGLATTAGNTVPSSHLDEYMNIIDINDIKPPQCSAIILTAIFYCPSAGGNCDGTDASELIIGSSANDNIQGGKGDDCIVGGDGNDGLKGEQGTDVCIAGPGTTNFHPSCEDQF